jgi:hypothetical protein
MSRQRAELGEEEAVEAEAVVVAVSLNKCRMDRELMGKRVKLWILK